MIEMNEMSSPYGNIRVFDLICASFSSYSYTHKYTNTLFHTCPFFIFIHHILSLSVSFCFFLFSHFFLNDFNVCTHCTRAGMLAPSQVFNHFRLYLCPTHFGVANAQIEWSNANIPHDFHRACRQQSSAFAKCFKPNVRFCSRSLCFDLEKKLSPTSKANRYRRRDVYLWQNAMKNETFETPKSLITDELCACIWASLSNCISRRTYGAS